MSTDVNQKELSREWMSWIAHNALIGGDPARLASVLVDNGFDEVTARGAVQDAMNHPYVTAAKTLANQVAKRDWLLHTTRMMHESGDQTIDEVWDSIPLTQFHRDYYRENRPLIIRNGMKWAARQRWTVDYLREKVGAQTVEVQANRESDPEYEMNCRDHKREILFCEFMDIVYSDLETNDYYMTANNSGVNAGTLKALWGDLNPLPEMLNAETADERMFFWMGPKGTVTPIHHDLTNNLMAQVSGRKRIKLIAPEYLPFVYNHRHCYSPVDLENIDYERFPLFKYVKVIDITIGPGDLFFLPVGWWHHVRGLDATITITCTNFREVNHFVDHYKTFGAI